jgi:microcystin-dependent protein
MALRIRPATYPNLFAIIGYYYGGSGANFNVPDCRGRTTVGTGQGSGLTNRTLGVTGGEESHVLQIGEIPSHSHTFQYTGGTGATIAAGANYTNVSTASTSNTGGSGGHNTMPPFMTFNKIIKT